MCKLSCNDKLHPLGLKLCLLLFSSIYQGLAVRSNSTRTETIAELAKRYSPEEAQNYTSGSLVSMVLCMPSSFAYCPYYLRLCLQVAINWCICKGTIPIPGVKSLKQAEENVGALGWQLSADEVLQLENAALESPRKMIQNVFQTR